MTGLACLLRSLHVTRYFRGTLIQIHNGVVPSQTDRAFHTLHVGTRHLDRPRPSNGVHPVTITTIVAAAAAASGTIKRGQPPRKAEPRARHRRVRPLEVPGRARSCRATNRGDTVLT